jgi:outer membrane immunogenic protein
MLEYWIDLGGPVRIEALLGTNGSEKSQAGDWVMKKILLGSVGLVALCLSSPASAADLAARPYTKAPPPMVAPIYDWSGFYIGVNGGGGSSHKSWDFVDPATGLLVPEGSHNTTGGTVGGQIGYRWQAASWVFGLEAQGTGPI